MSGKRILLLGVYGMEMVECGGMLCKNAKAGGASHASFLFTGAKMREDLAKSAKILGVTVEHLGMDAGSISGTREEKLKVVGVIRRFRPDIVVTQDPEHCVEDFDPGRRPAMEILLEGISLAGREYALDELPGLSPHRVKCVYYMTPEHPNCYVDIYDAWDEKCRAMDCLESQLAFIGELTQDPKIKAQYGTFLPELSREATMYEYGRAVKRLQDMAYHMAPGASGHNAVFLAEGYRRAGAFVFDSLPE